MAMLEKLRAELRKLLEDRTGHQAALEAVLAAAEARDDSNLTDDETKTFNASRDALRAADESIDALDARIKEIEDLNTRNEARAALAETVQPTATPEADQAVHVRRDDPVYRQDRTESVFADAYAVRFGIGGDANSASRLEKHMNEVRAGVHGQLGTEVRDVGTSAFGALVVPNYLPEMYAEFLRAGRVTANLATNHDLPPSGMTMEIPRGTTGTAVAAQTAENFSVTEVDFDETTLSVPVRTYGGMQDISRQAIERGYNIDSIIYADLAGAYAVRIDTDVISGAGTSGTHMGILSTTSLGTVTYSATAPTVAGLISKLADAIQQVNSTRFLPADFMVMHPRRWGWLVAASDSSGRPLVVPSANIPQNAQGVGTPAAYGYVGQVLGLPVYTDANIPTTVSTTTTAGATEDRIIVGKAADLHLWENGAAPRQFRFEERLGEQLTIRLVVAGYSAFTAGHHIEGLRALVGAGLTTPTF